MVDRVKDRFSTDEHSGVLTDFVTAQAHKPLVIGIEDKTFGTGLINELRADKPEWVIVPLKADRDKISRGTPYSSAVNGGHVWFPDPLLTPWGVNWENEHTNFPRGTHDDQVDCGAYAWFHSRTYLRPGERGPGEPAAELPVPTHVQRGMAQVRRRQGRKEHPYNQLLRNAQVGGL
ncbi:MAG: hypothetical protein GY930_19640 [bacterium]|nr:hypothetical protein [bacterium]